MAVLDDGKALERHLDKPRPTTPILGAMELLSDRREIPT